MLNRTDGTVIFLAVLLVAGGCSNAPPYAAMEPGRDAFEPFEIPLRVNEQGVATLIVDSSSGPLELILDTGADQAILLRADAPVVDDLQRIGSEWRANASGRVSRSPVYVIPEVQLGRLRFNEVRATLEESTFPAFMPGDGMLGRAMLENLTIDIDLPSGRLGILPAGALPTDFEDHDWITVPLIDMRDGPVASVRLDDSESTLRMVMDTGAIATGPEGPYGVVELPSGLTPQPEPVEGLPVYRAQAVHIGDGSIGPMWFYVMDHSQPPDTDGFLGNVLYRDFRVIIDPMRERISLSRNAAVRR